ncbi:MAG: T9SS type A sorting domain-containing protein [Tannerellaceae bacterium]|jgi:hypothetical protein|nr:T9SS type A sorting domain-containing protein [Tannerellaceae bacterium]
MMKRFLIFTVLFSLGISVFAQEYYRWYRGEKYPLILDPTRKLIWVHSADDTLDIKNRLIEQNIQVLPFIVTIGAPHHCWAIIKSDQSDHFPDFTEDEMIVYEGGYFLFENGSAEGGLDPVFAVKLKNSDDFQELKKFAEENNVIVLGRDRYMPLWHFLYCTKASKGNSMQMANQLYESGLYDAAEFGLSTYASDVDVLPGTNRELEPIPDVSPTGIALPAAKPVIKVYRDSGSSENMAIEAVGDLIKEVEVFDLSGKLLHKSSYSGISRVNWKAKKGLYLVKISLQSGLWVYRKMII